AMAFPSWYYMDPAYAKTEEAKAVAKVCPAGAIQPDMEATVIEEKVAAVVWATGWKPYDAEKIRPYGFGQYANVTTNMRFERLASVYGPTGGKITRPSDGKEAKNVAFIQCAGSRDHNYLPFCSRVCCLASMKQAAYVRDQYPDSKVTVFYIDLRAMDRYESFLQKTKADENISWIKSKPARIEEDANGNPVVIGENTLTGERYAMPFDLVVLATGMEPHSAQDAKVPSDQASQDEYGFVTGGVLAAGCAAAPTDVASSVQSATAMAMKAIHAAVKRG
ncbi:MAG: CoB--CoM heterodisulfide reductase iron-sulfur subunit A family protein, partial [Magnetococcales bacterium]|nr:CoB--CoM heterodisulfide reductase iron-sulfur subunit A family protein [Magnetococcales bacterium]